MRVPLRYGSSTHTLLALILVCACALAPDGRPRASQAHAGATLPVPASPLTIRDNGRVIHLMPAPGSQAALSLANTVQNLQYYNGPVVHGGTTYAIFWLPAGKHYESDPSNDARYEQLIKQYFADIGGSSLFNVITQYYDTNGPIANANSSFGGATVDTTAYPHAGTSSDPLQDSDIADAVARALAAKGWQKGLNNFYFVYTALDVQSCAGVGQCTPDVPNTTSGYCAYHTGYYGQDGQPVIYANEPTLSSHCGSFALNNDQVAGSVINTTSHEQAEGVTDPLGDGWLDQSGNEIGDKCAYKFGTVAADGSNTTMNGRPYKLQMEWSNASTGCVIAYPATTASTATATSSRTATGTPTPSATSTVTATSTGTASPSATASGTPTATRTASPTATATRSATATSTATRTATSTATSTGTATASPSATATQPPPNLSIRLRRSGAFRPGSTVTFAVRVYNAGGPTRGPILVTDMLPQGTSYAGAGAPLDGWTLPQSVVGRELDGARPGDGAAALPQGGTTGFTFRVQIPAGIAHPSTLVETAAVSSLDDLQSGGPKTARLLIRIP